MFAPTPLLALLALHASVGIFQRALALDNGFGRKPLMGWNPYNAAGCTINQTYATTILNRFVELGFPEAGYKYYSVDCGWQGHERDPSTNALTYEADKWPQGMKVFAEKVKAKGLYFGLYTDVGVQSCDTIVPSPRPGSLYHEEIDARALKNLGADYVKVDNCYIQKDINAPKSPRTDFLSRYGKFTRALLDSGIKGSLVCEWGVPFQLPNGTLEAPGEWAPQVGQQYRLSDDIAEGWINILRIMNQAIYIAERDLSGPSGFADADLLEVGNPGMTTDEQRTHFAFWSMFKSPLFISTNLVTITDEAKAILQNHHLIQANQDALGKPIKLIQRWTNNRDLFAGPLQSNAMAVLLVEQANRTNIQTISFADLGIASATALNMWTDETLQNVSSYSTSVNAHGSIPLKLTNIKYAPKQSIKYNFYNAADALTSGGSQMYECESCPGALIAGMLSASAAVTFEGVQTSKSESTLLFDYSNAEIQYGGALVPNVRGAAISVNGGEAQIIAFPISGYRWDDPFKGFKVRLTGFRTDANNTISIRRAPDVSPNAPRFSRMGIIA